MMSQVFAEIPDDITLSCDDVIDFCGCPQILGDAFYVIRFTLQMLKVSIVHDLDSLRTFIWIRI